MSVFLCWSWDYKDQSWGRSWQSEGTWGQRKHIFSLLRDRTWGWLASSSSPVSLMSSCGISLAFLKQRTNGVCVAVTSGRSFEACLNVGASKLREYLLCQGYLVPTWTFRHLLSTFSWYMHYLVLQTTCFYLISFLLLIVFVSLLSFSRNDFLNNKANILQ